MIKNAFPPSPFQLIAKRIALLPILQLCQTIIMQSLQEHRNFNEALSAKCRFM